MRDINPITPVFRVSETQYIPISHEYDPVETADDVVQPQLALAWGTIPTRLAMIDARRAEYPERRLDHPPNGRDIELFDVYDGPNSSMQAGHAAYLGDQWGYWLDLPHQWGHYPLKTHIPGHLEPISRQQPPIPWKIGVQTPDETEDGVQMIIWPDNTTLVIQDGGAVDHFHHHTGAFGVFEETRARFWAPVWVGRAVDNDYGG